MTAAATQKTLCIRVHYCTHVCLCILCTREGSSCVIVQSVSRCTESSEILHITAMHLKSVR
uniref:Uncharacterized protein n=1 Tax=Anguilla anguilla TaxID=7936 RepID=A0A0E9TDY4_ANGAN